MKRLTGTRRVAALALASLACAVSTGVTSLYILWYSLSPTDGAHGTPFLEFFADPFVLVVWVSLVCGAALLGGLVAVVTLWHTNLLISVPVVFATSVVAAAVTGGLSFFISALVALGAAMLAMQACYSSARWSVTRRMEASLFGRGVKQMVGRKS